MPTPIKLPAADTSSPFASWKVEHVGSAGSADRGSTPGQFVAMLGFAATSKTFSKIVDWRDERR
jgi:hypothetical protein